MRKIQWNQNVRKNNESKFKDAVNELLSSPSRQLILDIKGMKFAHDRTFGILANAAIKANKKNRELVIIRAEQTMQELFSIICFDKYITILADEKAAFDYFYKDKDLSVLMGNTINQ